MLIRQTSCESDDGAFGGGVVEEIRAADLGIYGGAVDDGVAALHMGEGGFG